MTEKVKALAEDDFKQVRRWMESDEDTLIITIDFLKKIRIEGKRSIKLTNDKIKHPGSLGANPKRQASLKGSHPSQLAAIEEQNTAKNLALVSLTNHLKF